MGMENELTSGGLRMSLGEGFALLEACLVGLAPGDMEAMEKMWGPKETGCVVRLLVGGFTWILVDGSGVKWCREDGCLEPVSGVRGDRWDMCLELRMDVEDMLWDEYGRMRAEMEREGGV